ncbi:MAG: potassium/proton antiporter [Prevotellaceae bacterium]|jgi:cell volume regulation protein A|nr:potassium/proton antiporter [Prevotellaceae bacterium]
MAFSVDNVVFIVSFLLFVSIIAGKTGYKFGVPILVLFLGVGMIFGHDGVGLQFSNPRMAQFIGVVALNIILFSGGMDTKYVEIRPILVHGIILATLGVLLTALITGFFIYWLTQQVFTAISFSILEALLLASVMSSTDSASVFAILGAKGLTLKERLRPLLELESGSNDPMAYMLTITFIQWIESSGEGRILLIVGNFVLQIALGVLLGYFLGRFIVRIINRIDLDNESLYPVLLISVVYIVFSITTYLRGNGYLAVYISGLVIGNSKFVHKKTVKRFMDGMTWLFQIVMFLTLGLLVNPSELLPIAAIGMAISLFMIFFARPIAVWICLIPFKRISNTARHYVSWVGLRGAAPILFATYPWTAELEHAKEIFNIVFFVTLVSLLLQGTTVPTVAKWMKLIGENRKKDIIKNFDVDFLDDIKSTISEITITEAHIKNGNRIMDMPMPEKTLVVMVKRKEHFFVPTGSTELAPNDILLVISDNERSLKETYAKLGIKT